jgi:predicted transcriptional regulator
MLTLPDSKKQGASISEGARNTLRQIQNLKKGLSLLRAMGCKQYKTQKLLCHWIKFSLSDC